MLTRAVVSGAVVHAFGTGHSESFAMEIAGRAGGLIPTNKIALRDLVLRGTLSLDVLGGSGLERNPAIVTELWDLSPIQPGDVFVIASNSGVNGSIVGFALLAKENGHPVIAVTSMEHTMRVTPKHRKRSAALRRCRRRDRQPGAVRRRHSRADRRSAGGLGVVHHQRLHRPTADHRRGRADRAPPAKSLPSTCPPTSPAATSTTLNSNRSTATGSGAAPEPSPDPPHHS